MLALEERAAVGNIRVAKFTRISMFLTLMTVSYSFILISIASKDFMPEHNVGIGSSALH